MSLPKINQPLYRLTIPSTGEEIRFRSFLVKEEKILVMAMESGEPADIADAITQVINNCIVTEGIDVEKLASFDIEWIFLNLRVRSVSDVIDLNKKCSECDEKFEFQINLNEVKPPETPTTDTKVEITDEVGVILKYPSLSTMSQASVSEGDIDSAFGVVASCIDSIYDADKVYNSRDHSKEELVEWVLDLSKSAFEKIEGFFDSIPAVRHETEVTCIKCQAPNSIVLEGLNDFLD